MQDTQVYTKAASELNDNGRAGTLTRLEEIVEYSKLRGYSSIGVAYCYGMEKEAILYRITFIENIPGNFNLIKVEEFKTKLKNQKSPEDFYLLDLRNLEAFSKDGIPDSINCLLNNLPNQYRKLLPDRRKEVIIYCNGGIQSIYGVMFLALKGYTNVKSLAGGYSKFLQLKN